ncbi:MAG: NAD-dependent deacetylase [Epsilonproteobacteria bacterium]|nr:NAD-dependent deacetylase [Campylobacterota bacterium]
MRIYVLSGAGLSAESGIPTFRDGGLWDRYDVMEVCSAQGYAKDPQKVHRFYDERRRELAGVEPNAAHYYFAELEKRYDVVHLTQNVDDLLERAGAKNVVHLHGRLRHLRCLECGKSFDIGYESQEGKRCVKCGSLRLRPDIVFFGESAPEYRCLYTTPADLFIAVGTSGRVIDVADIATHYPRSILIDPARHKRITMLGEFDEYLGDFFDYHIAAPVTEAIERLEQLF